ncbi:solid-state culture-specific protein-like protein [Penicillium longicatenatum]|nr:solid-state culture-specific protein-like protein [Penicillium longicatenatum]
MAPALRLRDQITLDNTLANLYTAHGNNEGDIFLFNFIHDPALSLKYDISSPTRFVYQYGHSEKLDTEFAIRLCLQLYPLHFSFIAGRMPVYLMSTVGNQEYLTEVRDVFQQVTTSQRPQLEFVKGPADLVCPPEVRLAIHSPSDCLSHLSHLVHPDAHYLLQAKRTLASSGIPTPATEIVDSLLPASQFGDEAAIESHTQDILARVQRRKLPFVLKLQQSGASLGTFILRSNDDLQRCIPTIQNEIRQALCQVDSSNHHFHNASLVMQDLISGDAKAVSTFVPKTGDPVFLGACDQLMNEDGKWIGGSISYGEQDDLSKKYSTLMKQIAEFVQQDQYQGLLGVDVMTDAEGNHLAIDLNPRCAGTTALCVLRGYLSRARNLHEAAMLLPFMIPATRTKFEEDFGHEFDAGKLIITAWCSLPKTGCYVAGIVAAAETKEKLKYLTERLQRYQASAQ